MQQQNKEDALKDHQRAIAKQFAFRLRRMGFIVSVTQKKPENLPWISVLGKTGITREDSDMIHSIYEELRDGDDGVLYYPSYNVINR